ncbi:BLUF domain-containing protein [Sphingomonas qilianensis]|uniref:BLUF domain-containing protein n=1 Tax=Sphingomonas qilianensis TaxID=1736690 RepID=A0ABU9XWQ3_9SPHN
MPDDLLKSLMYASTSQLVYYEGGNHVRDIVEYSRAWNASVGITGALVSSEQRFVQFVEGPSNAIDELLSKLRADRRHSGVTVIEERIVTKRRFAQWNLAYSGPDIFMDRDLAELLHSGRNASNLAIAARLKPLLSTVASCSWP